MSALPLKPDKAQTCGLSDLCQSRPNAPQQREHHSKISSARPDGGSGTVMPNARAVFKLMNISTLAACCTGRSAGLPPRKACNKSNFDWIGSRFKNDRNGLGRRLCCQRRRSAAGCNHCDLSTNELSSQRRQAIVTAFSPTVLNREVLAVDQTRFTQALPERCHAIGVRLRRAGTEENRSPVHSPTAPAPPAATRPPRRRPK